MMRLAKIEAIVFDRVPKRIEWLSDAALWDIVEGRTLAPNPAHRFGRRDAARRELLFRAATAGWPRDAMLIFRALYVRVITMKHFARLVRRRPAVAAAMAAARVIDTRIAVVATAYRILTTPDPVAVARTWRAADR